MRNNQPVTSREYEVQDGITIISKTDLKGVITYVNDDFIEVSGFSEQELLGQPHNIVRHPDMPAEAFGDLWNTLQTGECWSGFVKNRRKNGDCYWVKAFVSPLIENDRVVGYLSVRRRAAREAIVECGEIYRQLREGGAEGLEIQSGKVLRKRTWARLWPFAELSISAKLSLVIAILLAQLVAGAVMGLFGIDKANDSIREAAAQTATGADPATSEVSGMTPARPYQAARERYELIRLVVACGLSLSAVLALATWVYLRRAIVYPLVDAQRHLAELGRGNFRNEISIRSRDEIGRLLESIKTMQGRLDADVTIMKRLSNENLRIRHALEGAPVMVWICDEAGRIVYINKAFGNMLRRLDPDLKMRTPDFDAGRVVGRDAAILSDPPHQSAAWLCALKETERGSLSIGGRDFEVITSPIITSAGARLGAIVQWVDLTDELRAQAEIQRIVQAVSRGDFAQRVDAARLHGFYGDTARGLNQLMEACERGLRDVMKLLEALARGDLSAQMNGRYEGAFAKLKADADVTIKRLAEVIIRIKEATDTINTASREIAAGNSDLSQRTERQGMSLDRTASSMARLTTAVQNNEHNARQASHSAMGASDVAAKGGNVVGQVVATMGAINESSRKIADIIGVIDGIAFQTNILALNAAVEAARAGEQGKGFAVVATEVRQLAQRSAAAAKEIKELIVDSVDKVNNGSKLVDQAGKTMGDVVDSIRRVTDIMAEITTASSHQSAGIAEVNQAVAEMDGVTQQNAALVEQAAAAAESLEEQARNLAVSVSVFKLPASFSQTSARMVA